MERLTIPYPVNPRFMATFIDRQHQHLIDACQRLLILAREARALTPAESTALIVELEHAVEAHFADEGRILCDLGFSHTQAHIEEDRQALVTMRHYLSALGTSPRLTLSIALWLNHWLHNKIDADRKEFAGMLDLKVQANPTPDDA